MRPEDSHTRDDGPRYETRQPFDLAPPLRSRVQELELEGAIGGLQEAGYALLHDAVDAAFTMRLRETILRLCDGRPGASMLFGRDPIFEEVVLHPKALALVEVMCGKGALLSQVAASVRRKDGPVIALHADQNWTPAPFPVHNQMLTFCWFCDEATKAGGTTLMVPHSQRHRRHPSADEIAACDGAIALEGPAGMVGVWDGSVWHGNWPRTIDGERVVLHVTYSRLALRPVESYDHLDDRWLQGRPYALRVLLGREDFLSTPHGAFAHGDKLQRTFTWARQ